jgi:hypothetical protein
VISDYYLHLHSYCRYYLLSIFVVMSVLDIKIVIHKLLIDSSKCIKKILIIYS